MGWTGNRDYHSSIFFLFLSSVERQGLMGIDQERESDMVILDNNGLRDAISRVLRWPASA